MTIETKYKIGDEVVIYMSDLPISCIIKDIHFVEDNNVIKIVYSICSKNESFFGTRFGNELFPAKE